MTTALDRRIRLRIARIARTRRGDRENLREHILSAAEDAAGDGPVTQAHIDAAFDRLGTPAEIRNAFFPRQPRTVPAWAIVAFSLAALLAAADVFSSKSATCSGDGEVTRCAVTAGNGLVTSLLTITPPLIVLASHFLGPRWLPTTLAVTWAAIFVLPNIVDDGLARTLGMLVAGIISIAVAGILWRQRGSS